MSEITSIEHKELKGITIKNIIVTIISTASIVASVSTTYFALKSDISDVKNQQEMQGRINEIRLKALEEHVTILQNEVDKLKDDKQPKS